MKSKILITTFVLATALAPAAFTADDHTNDAGDQHHAADAKTFPGHGTVNSVDAAGGKVNLSHDPIKTLKWPKMTMDFTVHDAAMLKDIKPGTEVDFELMKIAGTYQITKITPTPK
jgi:Cu/Ag efflux protein CusF